MSKGIELLEDTVLGKFLGAEGVNELRSQVIEMIIEEIRDQLRESSEYIIAPNDIASELYERVINDIAEEIKEEYTEKITEAVQIKISALGI